MSGIINFFQNIFDPVINVMGVVLLYFHNTLGAPWWLSIVFLTALVRTVLFPLTVKQVRSMRSMQDLKPDLDKIKTKYPGNRQKQQEEQMRLYQERGINPLGGCLPVLVQMPVFIGVFYVIRRFGGFHGTPPTQPDFHTGGILWFQDLSNADPLYILPILSAVTMLLSMEITNKSMEPQQRWLMRLMPIGITAFLWTFPAGLFMYWITNNVFTFLQNYAIYNYGPGRKTPATATNGSSNKESNGGGGQLGKVLERFRSQDPPQTNGNGHQQGSSAGPTDEAAQAAKAAKRKRRKKKK